MSINKYRDLDSLFNDKECKLLTTFDEYKDQKGQRKVKFIARCGHENSVFVTNFMSKNSGVICKNCMYKHVAEQLKTKVCNDKHHYAVQGYNEMMKILGLLTHDFEYNVTGEGCLADVAIKPIDNPRDEWLKLQFKTTLKSVHDLYSFKLQSKYIDCVIILYCIEANKIWLLDGNDKHPNRVNIGLKKSIYNKYEVSQDILADKLKLFYNRLTLYMFEEINKPITINSQIEQEYQSRRETIFPLDYQYPTIPSCYDFLINNFRVQEKVVSHVENRSTSSFNISIHRTNRTQRGEKRSFRPYQIGDNDYYWINMANMSTFFIIPEKVLADQGYINIPGVSDGKCSLYINLNNKDKWYNNHKFDYKSTTMDVIKTIFKII